MFILCSVHIGMFALLLVISSRKSFVPPAFSSLFSSVQKSEKIHYQLLKTQTRMARQRGTCLHN